MRTKITKEAIAALRRDMKARVEKARPSTADLARELSKLASDPAPRPRPTVAPAYLWDTEESGLGYKLTPRLKGSWIYQYRLPGRRAPSWYQIDRLGALPIPEARTEAKQLALDIARGGDPAKERAQGKLRTIAALIDGYEASRKAKGRRSAEQMAKTLRRHLFAAWSENKPALTVTKEDVSRILTDLVGQNQSQNANKVRRLMHSMFAWALSQGWVRVNPVAGTEPPAPETSRTRVLTDAELIEVWNASEKLNAAWCAAVRLLILTAQRRSEVGGMLLEELDLPGALWVIKAERSKNGNSDLTHLSAPAVAILSSLPQFKDCPYMLTTDGKRPIGGWSQLKSDLDAAILDARRAAATARGENANAVVPMPAWTIHDLRRTAATNMGKLGVKPHVIDRVLHHSPKRQGIIATYNMFEYAPERREALTLWGAKVDALVSARSAIAAPKSNDAPTTELNTQHEQVAGIVDQLRHMRAARGISPEQQKAELAALVVKHRQK